jgi:DNA-binding beta-propeller fold protein YncE
LFYNERRNKLYCANGYYDNDETVTVIDCSSETPITTIDIRVSPSSLAYDSAGDRLYCLSTSSGYVAVVDCERDTMVKQIRVGPGPAAAVCATNFRRMYVANRNGSSLSVIRDTASSGIETQDDLVVRPKPAPTIIRGVLYLPPASSAEHGASSTLLDISGRKVMELKPGANDVRTLAPGVYFVRAVSRELSTASCSKVVITR